MAECFQCADFRAVKYLKVVERFSKCSENYGHNTAFLLSLSIIVWFIRLYTKELKKH